MERTKIAEKVLPAYDYVIVGGGTAGCVLANRLSEDQSVTVLLLEAGYDDTEFPEIHIPAKCSTLQKTVYDWNYKTVPQKHACKGLKNQQMPTARGKVLGGSGSLNYMVHNRGTPFDYQRWEELGCEGWGYEQILPYFLKSENCLIPELIKKDGVRAVGGPLSVAESKFSVLADMFLKAGEELGYKRTDNSGREPIGFMVLQMNVCNGRRGHTAQAFLRPAMNRSNLDIVTHCHVTKVIIENKVATGVEFVRSDVHHTVQANQEVVLSAGTIGSAQLLMLSGIGPEKHLESLGIPVVASLPVGDGLQDHVMVFGIEFETDGPYIPGDEVFSKENQQLYNSSLKGPIATCVCEGAAYVRTQRQHPDNPNPDIQIHQLSGLLSPAWKKNSGMLDQYWQALFGNREGKHGFCFMPRLSHPKSRGSVRLRSANPHDYPLIDPNYLSHPDDVKTLVEGIKVCMQLGKTKAYSSLGPTFHNRILPGYRGTPYTDEYWEEYVRSLTQTVYHVVGTCRMGRADDPRTVTDPQLRVKGIDRLRVVDASVMPEITSGNTNAPTVMIAEKGADMIKQAMSFR
ncbi:L-sorbose 1-dehydrogenase-like [Liolophura sinensis]|uniref:L-sorbose 1-dehydrogenase-like n=1 Tax=Liolophura sinensis TaxID=3198878 RepID=UPI003158515A